MSRENKLSKLVTKKKKTARAFADTPPYTLDDAHETFFNLPHTDKTIPITTRRICLKEVIK